MPPGKDKESGLSPEITRLSAMLARDPNSKLFIPLAEEYIKAGMPDEAVMTLEEGLKANPFYMSARVMLGKAYLEKGDPDKAREQFETVVKSVPDNLLAHRRLAEIYRMQGRPVDAARSLKMITLLDPKDEVSKSLLAQLGSAPAPTLPVTDITPPVEEPPEEITAEPNGTASAAVEDVPPSAMEEIPAFDLTEVEEAEAEEEAEPEQAIQPGPDMIEMPVPDNMITLEEIRRVKPAEDIPAEVIPEEAEVVPDDVQDIAGAIPEAVPEDIPEGILEVTPEDMPEEDIPEVISDEAAESIPASSGPEAEEAEIASAVEAPGEVAAGYVLQKEALEDIFASYQDAPPEEDTKPEGETGVYEIEEDISGFDMEGFKAEPAGVEPVKKEPFETETLAELYVSQGFFDRAINIYKNLLVGSPDDEALRQKLEDVYLLASVDSTRAAEAARKEAEESAVAYEPVDFEALDEPEVCEAEPLEESIEQIALAGQAGYDEGAVRRLEQFLENIRRKAGS